MNPRNQFCPNMHCHASGRTGGRNIVIHSRKQRRYKCTCCGRTFCETHGTSLDRLKKPAALFVVVVTLPVHGCPVQAIVAAFGLDERTVSDWLRKAGEHARRVHEHMLECQQLDLGQVQGDEMRVKTQGGVLWMTHLLQTSQHGGLINTAYMERLNATFRQRLGCLARRTRALARTTHTVAKPPCSCSAASTTSARLMRPCPTPPPSRPRWRPVSPTISGRSKSYCTSSRPPRINPANGVAARPRPSARVPLSDHPIPWGYPRLSSSP